MKRYDSLSMTHRPMCESKEGDWVKYSDAKSLIHKHEQVAVENSGWFDCLKIDFDKLQEENQKLKEALNYPGDIPLMIQRAIAKEREDCALICAAILNEDGWSDDGVERAIIAIRARGKK